MTPTTTGSRSSSGRLAFSAPDRSAAERETIMTAWLAHGYDGLQLKRSQYGDDLDAPDRFRERWGNDPGLTAGLITGGRLDAAGLADLRRVIAFASATGGERVVFCHGEPRAGLTDADIVAFARTLAGVGREARSVGVRVSLHHHFDQPVMHRPDFDTFFAEITDDEVTLTVDTAHLIKSGIHDIAEVIHAFGPRIDVIHLKDIAGSEFVPLGEGEIDFAPVYAAIHAAAPGAWLVADEESGADVAGAMASCRDLIGAGMATAAVSTTLAGGAG